MFLQFVMSVAALIFSMGGMWALLSLFPSLHGMPVPERLGLIAAIYTVATAVGVSWAWFVSLIARIRGWQPMGCRFAGMAIAIPVFVAVATGHAYWTVNVFLSTAIVAALMAPLFAFPEKTLVELSEPPKPITLSTK
jgi:hypothetical protein